MKPPPFEYHAPSTVAEAVALLAEHGDDGKVLAGGQSLVPLMNLRLARPSALVDVARVEGLDAIVRANGAVKVGATARHAAVCDDAEVRRAVPLLAHATRFVGHAAIRNRGTVGGALAHADPAAEAPLVAVALGAKLVVEGPGGARTVAADDFFQGPFMTALGADELLVEARFPALGDRAGWGFRQVARRHGDFALVAVAAVVRVDGGRCAAARVAVAGVADRPRRCAEAETALVGGPLDAAACARAAEAVRASVDPTGDVHATADYRRDVAGVLVGRAVADAAGRAQGASRGSESR